MVDRVNSGCPYPGRLLRLRNLENIRERLLRIWIVSFTFLFAADQTALVAVIAGDPDSLGAAWLSCNMLLLP